MTTPEVVDASRLPRDGFGTKSPLWWGTLGFMCIEGTSLILTAATYLYLSRRPGHWAPEAAEFPSLGIPTAFLILGVISLIPAVALKRAAHRMDTAAVRWLLIVGVVVETVLVILRGFEFKALNVRWDTSAYGSIAWFLIGFHTTLLAFDLLETAGFTLLFFFGKVEDKHYSDVEDAALYWFFVILSWVPLYGLLYYFPRLR